MGSGWACPGSQGGADLRKAVADRLYVVTSDGGSCISDAVQETRKILEAACRLEGEQSDSPAERLAFEYPGAVQGVIPCDLDREEQVLAGIENWYQESGEFGCKISYKGLGPGVHASVCVDTFIDLQPKGQEGTSYFDVLCSPALYSGQEVTARVFAPDEENPSFEFFLIYFDGKDRMRALYHDPHKLTRGDQVLSWTIPDLGGHAIYRLGIRLRSEKRLDGCLVLKTLDWSNTPEEYRLGRAVQMTPSLTPWTTQTAWLKTFVASADHFCPDYTTTFSISHAAENGLATTGTLDWDNYSVTSKLTLSHQEGAGLAARAKGHRRYYGAVLTDGKACIYRQEEEKRIPVASVPFDYQLDRVYELEFTVNGDSLAFSVDGVTVVSGCDSSYRCGGAGFVVDSGAVLADGFTVKRVGRRFE